MKSIIFGLLSFWLVLSNAQAQSLWAINQGHSNVGFAIQWNEISFRTGEFKSFQGEITKAQDNTFEGAKVNFSADVAGIDLIADQLVQMVQGADFLDAAQFPKITFVSKEIKKVSANSYDLIGELTIKGKTQVVKFLLEDNGTVPTKPTVGAIKVTGNLNKADFGITGGAGRLGNLIVITSYFELHKK